MPANVREFDVIGDFRAQLVKFMEAGHLALADADSDVLRTLHWLETDRVPYWTTQLRKRAEMVSRCKDAVRQKTLYKDATGRPQSAIDEMKALKKAQALLEEAEQKLAASKAWLRRIAHAQMEYRGQSQKLGTTLAGELPDAIARLGAMLDILRQYAVVDQPSQSKSMATSEPEPPTPPGPKPGADDGST